METKTETKRNLKIDGQKFKEKHVQSECLIIMLMNLKQSFLVIMSTLKKKQKHQAKWPKNSEAAADSVK